MAKIQPIEIS